MQLSGERERPLMQSLPWMCRSMMLPISERYAAKQVQRRVNSGHGSFWRARWFPDLDEAEHPPRKYR